MSHGSLGRLLLAPEAGLERDERLPGVDGERGDGQSFDDLVGVGPQKRPVFEGSGFAFGCVADRVVVAPAAALNRGPLGAGGEPGAAPAPQTGQADLCDHPIRPELKGSGQAFAASACEVLLERGDRSGAEE